MAKVEWSMLRADRSDEESAIGISARRKPFDSSSMVVVIRAISISSKTLQQVDPNATFGRFTMTKEHAVLLIDGAEIQRHGNAPHGVDEVTLDKLSERKPRSV